MHHTLYVKEKLLGCLFSPRSSSLLMTGLLEKVELYFMFISDKGRKKSREFLLGNGGERDVPLINKDVGLMDLLAFHGNQEMKST